MRLSIALACVTCACGSPSGAHDNVDAATTADAPGMVATPNGNPDGSCLAGVPAGGNPADVSRPTTVVGTGTAASCTFDALDAAVTAGGVITFDCGPDPVTIAVTRTLNLPLMKDTVIDGGG